MRDAYFLQYKHRVCTSTEQIRRSVPLGDLTFYLVLWAEKTKLKNPFLTAEQQPGPAKEPIEAPQHRRRPREDRSLGRRRRQLPRFRKQSPPCRSRLRKAKRSTSSPSSFGPRAIHSSSRSPKQSHVSEFRYLERQSSFRLTGSIIAGFLRPIAVRFCGAYDVSAVLVPFAWGGS
jgi:hypothetical protein